MCSEHVGKEYLNKIFNISVEHLYKCLFTECEFNTKYMNACKYKDFKSTEWSLNENGEETRIQEYTIDLGALGTPKSVVNQVR